jgi:hypothetical protein
MEFKVLRTFCASFVPLPKDNKHKMRDLEKEILLSKRNSALALKVLSNSRKHRKDL